MKRRKPRKFDLPVERLEEALSQPSVMIPNGLTREQVRKFILGEADKDDKLQKRTR